MRMSNLENVRAIIGGSKPDRFSMPGILPLAETVEHWHQEGLPEGRDSNQPEATRTPSFACSRRPFSPPVLVNRALIRGSGLFNL